MRLSAFPLYIVHSTHNLSAGPAYRRGRETRWGLGPGREAFEKRRQVAYYVDNYL